MANFTEFNLPTNAYTGFDAQSLRDLIIDRINNDATINFTDQNCEGSNISALIDIIAYSYHTLLFYLNQTSSESNFNDAELVWEHILPESMLTLSRGECDRLSNGNTLISVADDAIVFEVDSLGSNVWSYSFGGTNTPN